MSAVGFAPLKVWQACGYTAAASWIIIVWNGIVTFDQEVEYVWPMPWTSHTKWLFLFGKYFALTLQTAVLVFQVGYLVHHGVALHHCRIYRLIEMAANTLLVLCFDAVLLLRIYALYGWRSWCSALATLGVLLEMVTTVAASVASIPSAPYDGGCVMIEIPKTIFVFVAGTFVSQAILLWLAFRKRERNLRGRSSVACVTIRDGLLVFLCFAVFLVVIFICTLHDSPATTQLIYFVPVVTSIATCRIILNIQETHRFEASPQFTTEIYGLYGSADSFLLSDGPFERRGL